LGKLVSVLDWTLEEKLDSSEKELQKNRVQRLISYIDENYRQKITLSTLADMEGITTTYMSHFFKKAFGVSFQTYLSTQRLEKALVLMHDKSLSMVDICMNCGFSDSRYLEAACKRTLGCSVSEYRKRLEQQDDSEKEVVGDGLHEEFGRKASLKLLQEYLDKHPAIGRACLNTDVGRCNE
jgi:AraC-like DNA-binding protein